MAYELPLAPSNGVSPSFSAVLIKSLLFFVDSLNYLLVLPVSSPFLHSFMELQPFTTLYGLLGVSDSLTVR